MDTFRNERWIDSIDIYGHPAVKNIAFAFKIFAATGFSVFQDAAVKLVNVLKPVFEQESRCLFAFDTPCAVCDDFFIFQGFQFT